MTVKFLVLFLPLAAVGEYLEVATVPRSACGPICLMTCCAAIEKPSEFDHVWEAVGPDDESGQTTLLQLRDGAGRLGLATEAVRWRDAPPLNIKSPAILPVRLPNGADHFIVLHHTAQTAEGHEPQMLVIDLPHDPVWKPVSELREVHGWDGTALYVAKSAADLAPVRHAVGRSWRLAALLAAVAAVLALLPWLRRTLRPTATPAVTAHLAGTS